MLKSTYKPSKQLSPLPPDWTEHKAPTGHTYYYNATTQQSTYTRPPEVIFPAPGTNFPNLYPPSGASLGYPNLASGLSERQPYIRNNSHTNDRARPDANRNSAKRPQPADRPKSKHPIPGCQPWLLIKTKLGRRFVHNPETSESLWKFPFDVMKGVTEYDRLEREKIKVEAEEEERLNVKPSTENTGDEVITTPLRETSSQGNAMSREFDSDEYEEVEVTDDEGREVEPKRQRTERESNIEGQPVEFNEDDIAYQLAAMGEDYGLDPGEYGEDRDDVEEGAQGLQLTMEDSKALFFDLLDDYRISPYSTWEKIMEEGHIIEDDRYVALPTMKARKDIWGEWSRDRIQKNKERKEKEAKQDPSIPYMAFLQEHATPKLFWPEFKRKYKKEPSMRDAKLSDKDREKWYREYVNRFRLPESKLKADLVDLLKSLPLQSLNRSVTLETLPSLLLKDLRYISVRRSIRDPMIETFVTSLPPAPDHDEDADREAIDKQRQEREGRERALAERQRQVNEVKRRATGALHYSRGMLRREEEEIDRARKVGKVGLLSYREVEQDKR